MLLPWGILLIALGASINKWALAKLLYPDGHVMALPSQSVIHSISGAFIGWGLLTILLRRAVFAKKLNLALFSLLVIAPIAGELFLRISFVFERSPTRNPGLYCSWDGDDDYWKLTWKWNKHNQRKIVAYLGHDLARQKDLTHALLGWSQDKVEDGNPFGLCGETLEQLKKDGKRRVLFYGDSFVAGRGDSEHRLPTYTNKHMPDVSIVDLGVPGYGVDQIHLMFRETWRMGGENPFIIIGILTQDLDRSVLGIRTAPKPRFGLDATGALTLDPTPLPRDPEEWLSEHPVGIRSYLFALAARKLRPLDYDPRVEEKKALNLEIIEATHAILKRECLDYVFVLFYGPGVITRVDWRETFLKKALDERSIPYIDTKAVIHGYCMRANTLPNPLYTPADGHHNNLGNEVIGDAIVAHLKARLARAAGRR